MDGGEQYAGVKEKAGGHEAANVCNRVLLDCMWGKVKASLVVIIDLGNVTYI